MGSEQPANVVGKKALRRRGPESLEWDKLKGRPVAVDILGSSGERILGELVWVDRYTIGVRMAPQSVNTMIIFKHAILGVSAYDR